MNKMNAPEMEVVRFENEDVLTVSLRISGLGNSDKTDAVFTVDGIDYAFKNYSGPEQFAAAVAQAMGDTSLAGKDARVFSHDWATAGDVIDNHSLWTLVKNGENEGKAKFAAFNGSYIYVDGILIKPNSGN